MTAILAAVILGSSPLTARAQLCPLDIVSQDESGHRNIPNYRYDAHHTAGGHWQITDTNWRIYAPMVEVDIRKWPNALSAPEQLQGQVAGIMKARLGCLPWVPYNARPRVHLAAGGTGAVSHTDAAATAVPTMVVETGRDGRWLRGRWWSAAQIARYGASLSVYDAMGVTFK